ncbi:hypothetical protein D8B45_02040 [Candidatus Gracilibacteria bacterium]|nr:MAG: hypothetical protein D8B45_02040 [Candidatus Gracilibacteria bacterium]
MALYLKLNNYETIFYFQYFPFGVESKYLGGKIPLFIGGERILYGSNQLFSFKREIRIPDSKKGGKRTQTTSCSSPSRIRGQLLQTLSNKRDSCPYARFNAGAKKILE